MKHKRIKTRIAWPANTHIDLGGWLAKRRRDEDNL